MLIRRDIARGPRVLIEPEGNAAVAAVYLWFRVGSAMEPAGLEGGAHFLEHLLFKGAGGHGVGEAASRVEGLGGELNAFTTYEQTVLHATVPAGREAEALGVLAEMATRPHLDPDELERERDVVVEEIRGTNDASDQLLSDGLRAAVFGTHPYGRPILGTEASVRGLSRDALVEFHRQWYRGSNAVLAVCGPIEPERVLAEAEVRLVDPADAPPARPFSLGQTTPQGRRFFTIDQGFEEQLIELGFPGPPLDHPDQPALDLLITALGVGESGVLSASLKGEQQLATDCWANLEAEPRGALITLGASAREGRALKTAEALAAAVARVCASGISAADLHRARNTILASHVHDRETADGRAHRLAWYEAFFGGTAHEAAYEAAVLRVTPRDLREVARRWLSPAAMSAGAVAPHKHLDRTKLERALNRGFSAKISVASTPDLSRFTLSNGARLIVRPEPESELASVSVVGVGGALAEGRANPGLSDVWAASVIRGAGSLDGPAFAEAIEERAGTMSPWAWRNSSGITSTFPGGELRAGLELLGDLLARPRFDSEEVARAREELDEARASAADAPEDLAWDLAWQELFRGHPWGRPAHGTALGIRHSTRSRLAAYHHRVFCGQNLVIAIAGAVDPTRAAKALERSLAALPEGAPVPLSPPTVESTFHRIKRVHVARQQARLVLAFPGGGWGAPDAPALRLLEAVLGGQGGRLFTELRERRGLAYDVGATAEEGLGGGAFLAALGTDPERTDEAWDALWGALEALTAAPISADELARCRARVVDGAVLDLQRCSDRAAHLASAERYGPGAEHADALIRAPAAVDALDLHRVAQSVLRRDRCVEVQVGPAP